jgi:hypothetical protein
MEAHGSSSSIFDPSTMSAASERPTVASYVVHEKVTVDTTDREDHTFSGVLFFVQGKDAVPLDHLVIESIAIRGKLGPITIWVTKESAGADADTAAREEESQRMHVSFEKEDWEQIYAKEHEPSPQQFEEMVFDTPVILRPRQTKAIYVHSTLPGDRAIVYDNQKARYTYDDAFLRVHPGLAHCCNTAFGKTTIWGWGNPWREHREVRFLLSQHDPGAFSSER